MTTSVDSPATRLATRLSFLVAGFGISCWAPLVPFAKERLQIDSAMLGVLLLCIGIGSILAMLATGPISARYGGKPVIVTSGIALALILPLLTIAATPVTLGGALLLFGAALGSLDVAMNVHAVEVERAAPVPLMSGFHALFSIGGFAGAALMTIFLSFKVSALGGSLVCAAIMLVAMLVAWPRLLPAVRVEEGPLFVRPHGVVVLLAVLAMATFLAEGAMLDWSALLITQMGLVGATQGGLGYILFAIAMTTGRLLGDGLTARLGDYRTLLGGGLLAVAGFVVLLSAPIAPVALAGFLLIGLGASNIVPVLFRIAGAQTHMPPALAIGAITTLGYAGILAGPAGIGVVAEAVGLRTAFWMLAVLLLLVPFTARRTTAAAQAG
ncbi:putative MFS family arabinose efflux permease [Sphingomonas kyeonggiensis]|uniref:Putative MFS family arabinose efflux permease n=1 Tax=Sphingomonas kyeonggiensis TaxID=1268553 RepID=A0A7W7NSQ7_9SPHN|nr:MFS transporter [Sphingomonas kyeonggiensis]MBB4839041.1 putative MFS family arabinose efflux permease [Sphingomonas kyeonggiensis]